MMKAVNIKIGELLVSLNLVTPEQVDKALGYQRKQGGKLGSIMVELGLVSDGDLAKALSEQLHLPAANSDEFQKISPSALESIPKEVVERHRCIPLLLRGKIRLAISDPWEIKALNEWAIKNTKQFQIVVAPEIWITGALERYYGITRKNQFDGSLFGGEVVLDEEGKEEVLDLVEEVGPVPEDSFSFPGFQKHLTECVSIEDVFSSLLKFLQPVFPQIALYVAKKGIFHGWIVQGFPVRTREFSRIQIDPDMDSPLRSIAIQNKPHSGPLDYEVARMMGFELLQIKFGQEVHFHPITFREKVTTVLMTLPGSKDRSVIEKEQKYVKEACKRVEAALEMLVYRKIILAPATI